MHPHISMSILIILFFCVYWDQTGGLKVNSLPNSTVMFAVSIANEAKLRYGCHWEGKKKHLKYPTSNARWMVGQDKCIPLDGDRLCCS